MKYIYADSLDFVDPNYDFESDRSLPSREPYWDDKFPHEILNFSPYDGILVSKSVVGGHRISGKYNDSQVMRFQRNGAREFLRFNKSDYPNSIVMGDCGAFSYHNLTDPPYSTAEIIDFYSDGRFDFGCSIDHIIFDFFKESEVGKCDQDKFEENKRRSELTLSNAREFIKLCKTNRVGFTPIGIVQGWSPTSMANAAKELQKMGYEYIAIGGMVPLNSKQIQSALRAIREKVGCKLKIHLLGFAKADQIHEFVDFNLASFDTTSPLFRAFMDGKRNFFLLDKDFKMKYYSAIRIPQAIENSRLVSLTKKGIYNQEDLLKRERSALSALRGFDKGGVSLKEALGEIMAYSEPLTVGFDNCQDERDRKKLESLKERYEETLKDMPWKKCDCEICQNVGVEVIVFRGSNRNKRRGIHNLYTFGKLVEKINGKAND